MTSDPELLRSYLESGAEEAFAELVRRHVDLVYSAALRQVNGDAYLAQDVVQTVFSELARQGGSLCKRPALTGWLYTTAHFAATKAVRKEHRRGAREQEAQVMQELLGNSTVEIEWEQLRPVLDQSMHRLGEVDREAILLRFFENRQLADIGRKLGLTEEAARKRVDRALDKLREFLSQRGITASSGLATVLSVKAVQTAPAGLAAVVITGAATTATGAGTAAGIIKLITMTKLQAGLMGAVVVAGITAPLVIQHQAEAEKQTLRSQLEQLPQLAAENERLSNLLAQAEQAKPTAEQQTSELLKLRSEVGNLRARTNDLARMAAEIERLRSQLVAMPRKPAAPAGEGAALPRETWVFSGYADPESALQTTLWAMNQSDTKTFFNSISPSGPWYADLQGRTENEVMQRNKQETEKVTAFRVLDREMVGEDEAILTIYAHGINESARFRMRRIANEWKFAGPVKGGHP